VRRHWNSDLRNEIGFDPTKMHAAGRYLAGFGQRASIRGSLFPVDNRQRCRSPCFLDLSHLRDFHRMDASPGFLNARPCVDSRFRSRIGIGCLEASFPLSTVLSDSLTVRLKPLRMGGRTGIAAEFNKCQETRKKFGSRAKTPCLHAGQRCPAS
jgi:hypothetical protein